MLGGGFPLSVMLRYRGGGSPLPLRNARLARPFCAACAAGENFGFFVQKHPNLSEIWPTAPTFAIYCTLQLQFWQFSKQKWSVGERVGVCTREGGGEGVSVTLSREGVGTVCVRVCVCVCV